MSIGEMVAVAGLALTVVGGLAHVVWLLATLKTELRTVARTVSDTYAVLEEHSKTCDEDRIRLNMTVDNHESRITHLEGGGHA